ncbi:amidohydrolase [Brevibacillus fluminis]|uniref:amidohydrolase n=1 Tax=Brevibacillus fluminis TaxID=511487 RepID=UPI003F8A5B8E
MNTQPYADLILSGNAVFTGLSDKPEPAAIAIVGNKIAAVGSKEEVAAYKGPQTKEYDAGDRLILPGMHDFHLHIMFGSIAMEGVQLFQARSQQEAIDMVRQHAQNVPADEWVLGFVWDAAYWDNQELPTRHSLDKDFPDRPVLLFHAEGHYAWVNSKALELAGITRDSENPPFGIIARDEAGEATGILYEGAIGLVANKAFDLPREKKMALFQNFLKEARSCGITSVSDLYGTDISKKLDDFTLFREAEEKGELTSRVHLFPALDGDLERARSQREMYQSDKLRVSGLKQFIDGVITGRTAWLIGSYADMEGHEGEPAFPVETIMKWVEEADKEGFNVRFHSIGEAAIRLALDAFEQAAKVNGPRDRRHAVEHVEVIHPDDIARFGQLGVIASQQPDHMAMSERGVYTERIGAEREPYVFVTRSLQQAGAPLAFSSDFPIDVLNPMIQIHRAVTRLDSSGKNVWHPEQRVSLADALRAYTWGGAYGTEREHELGTLEAGKLADIAVLDRNLFDVPVEQIPETKAVLTVMDGKIVFSAE